MWHTSTALVEGGSGVVGARGEPGVRAEGEQETEVEAEGEAGGVPLTIPPL